MPSERVKTPFRTPLRWRFFEKPWILLLKVCWVPLRAEIEQNLFKIKQINSTVRERFGKICSISARKGTPQKSHGYPPSLESIVFLTQKYYLFMGKTLCFRVLKTILLWVNNGNLHKLLIASTLPNLVRIAQIRPRGQLVLPVPVFRVKRS